jgi:hypothetical protein
MSKEIVDLFEYILDQLEPRWRVNEAVVETLDRLRDGKSKRFGSVGRPRRSGLRL